MKKSKEQKFIELAEKRVNVLLNNIRLVKQLSNKNNYQYSDTHVKKIFAAINTALNDANEAFNAQESKKNVFKL
jgi:hypothetical protein